MSVPNRPRTTQQFFQWYFSVGPYKDHGRPMFVGERALSAWCKIIDACGDVLMAAFRNDCLAYVEKQNEKHQRQLEDQSFFWTCSSAASTNSTCSMRPTSATTRRRRNRA